MKYLKEFRNPELAKRIIDRIHRASGTEINIMEFCGGHTVTIFKNGIRQVVPPTIHMLSGPGCPVCVTSNQDLDKAAAFAKLPDVILATYGDMIRVPGSYESLSQVKADGCDVRIVYSPLDALKMARKHREKIVIFFAVGFETSAPAAAASVLEAESTGLDNYFVTSVMKLTVPVMKALLNLGEVKIDGVIGPGHVSTVIGSNAWNFLPDDFGIPCVVSGFEPLDILRSVEILVQLIEGGEARVENEYTRSVKSEGNLLALKQMYEVFETAESDWRGFGVIPQSGLRVRAEYGKFDAERNFKIELDPPREIKGCRCGEVLRGVLSPDRCALFGKVCTPETPSGPCMVSSE
ncbi:MAG: hydrogenase formation protein HypD, partial [Fidelibacterota bacterium]